MSNKLVDNIDLMNEYDYEKNTVNINELTLGSEKKIWWKCSQNHSYLLSVCNKVKSKGCPYCNNRRVLQGYNDVATTNPEIARLWNYEKNGDIQPSNIVIGSRKRVWLNCEHNHSYQIYLYNAISGTSCPYCSNRKLLKGFNDLATTNPELLEEWDFSKNSNILPSEIMLVSSQKVWWKCKKCNYEWKTQINLRKNHNCPNCAHKKIGSKNAELKNNKSLLSVFPNVINVWNYEKNNGLLPENFSPKSNKAVWWKCSICGKEWKTAICAKSHTTICRECTYFNNNRKYVKKRNK